ncbi:hypothetical protein REPUB_Repub14bG0119900 [Reevesia pubescens]
MGEKMLHIAMYPWFAVGHITSFLHLSNKLAERGHKISFFLPTKTQSKFEPFNLHPDLITFIPIEVPHIDGLPFGIETTADIPLSLQPLLVDAMDHTEPAIEASLSEFKPHFLFYDFASWSPVLCHKLGIKSVHYYTISPATVGYLISPTRKILEKGLTDSDLMEPPLGFPSSSIKLRTHEARGLAANTIKEYGGGVSLMVRQLTSLNECDAIGFKTCREIEGPYCDYIEEQFEKPVILAGPVVPGPPNKALEEKWEKLLSRFQAQTVIFCAFGSECVLSQDQFQELVLGLELTGLPFLVALKPSMGAETTESALPEGFQERVKGRGFVHGDWVPQQLILRHPSVGCFVTHCGSGSLSEAMVSDCQLVMLPHVGDQIINARLMAGELKVGVEVEKGEEDGVFTKDDICKAVMAVMDDDSEVGKETRANQAKWKEFLLDKGVENSYIDSFVDKLHQL